MISALASKLCLNAILQSLIRMKHEDFKTNRSWTNILHKMKEKMRNFDPVSVFFTRDNSQDSDFDCQEFCVRGWKLLIGDFVNHVSVLLAIGWTKSRITRFWLMEFIQTWHKAWSKSFCFHIEDLKISEDGNRWFMEELDFFIS